MGRAARWCGQQVLPPLAFLVLVLGLWQAATMIWEIPIYLLPPPARVLDDAREHAGALLAATRTTGEAAMCGFALSLLAGTAIGFILSQSRLIERGIYPYAIFLQTVPIIAIAPLVVTWFGAGLASVIVVSFILSLFPIITNATAGLTAVDPNLLELFEIHNASRVRILLALRLPNAVPSLVTGAKISCGLSVIGAIVGEMFAGYQTGSYGLGYLISATTGSLKTSYLFAAVLCSTLLSIVIFASVSLLGGAILARWHIHAPRAKTAES